MSFVDHAWLAIKRWRVRYQAHRNGSRQNEAVRRILLFKLSCSLYVLRSKFEIVAMALTTTFIVVPFLCGAKTALHPGAPRRSLSRAAAIAMADSLAPFYAGVIVLRDRNDPGAGIFVEPLLICVIGDVPGDLLEQLAA